MLPLDMRSDNGVFYTPTALSNRLIEMSISSSKEWSTISVVDPACGGGAFLIPIAYKIAEALKRHNPCAIIAHIETHLKGYEIDHFAAWLCQVFIEVALKDLIDATGKRLANLITVCNTLEYQFTQDDKFDLVIGNPPYGKIKLTEEITSKYKQSLYGHPNLYGLFTHVAINIVKENGKVAYLTPTSFLSGEYFKNLRLFLRTHTVPLEIDFVSVRKGVFEDVLQETMLATYRVDSCKHINESLLKVAAKFRFPKALMQQSHLPCVHLPKASCMANLAAQFLFLKRNLFKPTQKYFTQ